MPVRLGDLLAVLQYGLEVDVLHDHLVVPLIDLSLLVLGHLPDEAVPAEVHAREVVWVLLEDARGRHDRLERLHLLALPGLQGPEIHLVLDPRHGELLYARVRQPLRVDDVVLRLPRGRPDEGRPLCLLRGRHALLPPLGQDFELHPPAGQVCLVPSGQVPEHLALGVPCEPLLLDDALLRLQVAQKRHVLFHNVALLAKPPQARPLSEVLRIHRLHVGLEAPLGHALSSVLDRDVLTRLLQVHREATRIVVCPTARGVLGDAENVVLGQLAAEFFVHVVEHGVRGHQVHAVGLAEPRDFGQLRQALQPLLALVPHLPRADCARVGQDGRQSAPQLDGLEVHPEGGVQTGLVV